MNFPIQLGPPQFILLLVGVIGLGLLIHSAMSITGGRREIFEDKDGNRFYGRRRLRWKRGVSGILLLLIAVSLLWATFLVQSYLGLTSDIKVAQVHASTVSNLPHMMSVELTLYDNNGKSTSDSTYFVQGDRWMVQGNIVKFPSWLNILGLHSGYKLTRLEGQYDDPNDESTMKHTVVTLNGGDGAFFKTVYKQAWSSPFVDAAYGNAVIIPADGHTYNVLVSQTGLYAKPA
ncbi:MAG TPA: hypothetical protein VII61_05015 [Ktedonobacteraceae bacterium]|jgi:hypothetical protein